MSCLRDIFVHLLPFLHIRNPHIVLQAETEQLAKKVETLGAENVALRSEISRLSENSSKLRLENSTLMVPSDSPFHRFY